MNTPDYRPLSIPALVATAVFLALGLITVVSMVSTVAEIGLLQQIANGETISQADASRNDSRQALLGYLYIGGLVVAAISFLVWLNHASANLAALGADGQRFSPGWAVGWWFVPIFWLWRPYQVVKEVWQGSYPVTGADGPADWRDTPVSPLLGWWWAAWLVSNWLSVITARLFFSGDTVQELIRADWLSVVSNAISLGALALVIVLIRQITSNQGRKHVALPNGIPQGAALDSAGPSGNSIE